MEILLEGLLPGREYKVQARAVNAEGVYSKFSGGFFFYTVTDTTAPNPPGDVTWTAVGDTFVATWTAPTHNEDGTTSEDLDGYAIRVTSPVGQEVYYGLPADAGRFEFKRGDNVASFGYFRKTLTFEIKSRDTSNNLSPAISITASKAAPSPVTGLALAYSGSSIIATWTGPTTNSDATPLVDLLDYNVTVSRSGSPANRTYFVTQPSFEFSYEENKAVFGSPQGAVTFTVKARNETLDESTGVEATSVNPAPAAPTGLSGSIMPDAITLRWTRNTEDDMLRYDVYTNTTGVDAGAVYADDTTDPSFVYPTVAYNQDVYFAVKAVDIFGQASAFSAWAGPFRPKSPFVVDTDAPTATTLTATTSARPQSEPAAVDLAWPASVADDLAGYHIRYSVNVLPRVWQYHDVIEETATSAIVSGLASETSYVFNIRSYDKMVNTSAWSADAIATSSISAVPPGDITSDIQILTGGVLRSENFVEANPAAVPPVVGEGWRLMPSGLDIYQGSINAAVVKTGQLRSNQLIGAGLPDAGQPAWVIDTEGDMTIRSAYVKGKIIVGNATGGSSTDLAIASANYGGTGAQWSLRGDGTFDVKSGTGARLEMSSAGLIGHDGTKQTFNLTSAGVLTLDGNITARGGTFHDSISVTGSLNVYGTGAYIRAARSGTGAWVELDGRSGTDYAINSSTAKFRVNYDGILEAQDAVIAGNITAHSATIKGIMTVGDGTAGEKYIIVNGTNGGSFVIDGRTSSSYAAYAHNGTGYTWYIDKYGNSWYGGSITLTAIQNAGGVSLTDVDSKDSTTYNNSYNNSTSWASTNTSNSIVNERSASTTITNKYVSSSRFYAPYTTGHRVEMGNGAYNSYGFTWRNDSTVFGSLDIQGRTTRSGRWPNYSYTTSYPMYLNASDGLTITGTLRAGNIDSDSVISGAYTYGYYGVYDTDRRVITSVNGKTGDSYGTVVSITAADVGASPTSHTHNYISTSGGTIYGSLSVSNNVSAYAYFRYNSNGEYFRQVSASGLYIGDNTQWRGITANNVSSGGTKTFVINHPSPEKKDTHFLVHNCLEGPTADVYYRGRGQLQSDNGMVEDEIGTQRVNRAIIKLPDYFEDIAELEGRTVSVTPIVGACKNDPDNPCNNFLAPALGASEVRDGEFKVYELAGFSHPCCQFYWEVKAVRKDISQPEVEPLKSEHELRGEGPYSYLVAKT